MRYKKLKLTAILFIGLGLAGLHAQKSKLPQEAMQREVVELFVTRLDRLFTLH